MFRGIGGGQNDRRIRYHVTDVDSDQDAIALTTVAAPQTYDLMPQYDVTCDEITKKATQLREFDPINFPGEFIEEQSATSNDGEYYTTAHYSRSPGKQPVQNDDQSPPTQKKNNRAFSFQQSLENVTIRESPFAEAVRYIDNTGTPADPLLEPVIKFAGINDEDGEVRGVSVRRPIGSFQLDFFPLKASVTDTWLENVINTVGATNTDVFYGYQPGEVLFVSAVGRDRNPSSYEFTFRWETRKNVVNAAIGSGSNLIRYSAPGWYYVWVHYEQITQDVGPAGPPQKKKTLKIPRQVNVEQVYPLAKFGNGTPNQQDAMIFPTDGLGNMAFPPDP